jgi:hypothetical protein
MTTEEDVPRKNAEFTRGRPFGRGNPGRPALSRLGLIGIPLRHIADRLRAVVVAALPGDTENAKFAHVLCSGTIGAGRPISKPNPLRALSPEESLDLIRLLESDKKNCSRQDRRRNKEIMAKVDRDAISRELMHVHVENGIVAAS